MLPGWRRAATSEGRVKISVAESVSDERCSFLQHGIRFVPALQLNEYGIERRDRVLTCDESCRSAAEPVPNPAARKLLITRVREPPIPLTHTHQRILGGLHHEYSPARVNKIDPTKNGQAKLLRTTGKSEPET
mgnify:CR=1 FL=1